MKTILATLAAGALSACVTNPVMQPQEVRLSTAFDQAATERLLQPGGNTIKGSALIRQAGGGVVTCAGGKVQLVPATPYSDERVRAIYGASEKGYRPRASRAMTFIPDDPGYQQATRMTLCDAQGFFKFDGVGDGSFYVVSGITWTVGQYNPPQGGTLFQKVSVTGGVVREVVLAP